MSTKGGTVSVANAAKETKQALDLFKQAAETQTTAYTEGLSYYKTSLDEASKQFQSAYTEANSTLRPLSDASNKALNEQMKMMGLNPISATADYVERFKNVTSQYGSFEGQDTVVQNMMAAEKITDPAERATALSGIKGQIEAFSKSSSTLQSQISALGSRPGLKSAEQYYMDTLDPRSSGLLEGMSKEQMVQAAKNSPGFWSEFITNDYDVAMADDRAKIAEYDAKVGALQAGDAKNKVLQDKVGSFGTEYSEAYTPEFQAGYSGEQATAKLAQTPGYQFALDQGTRATERQGAARGMLGSGNTLTALQSFGQDLATNTYQGYMANLSNIIAEGSGATAAISNNQIALGNTQAGLTQLYGQAQMNTENAIGNAQASSAYQQGQLTYAAANAQANRANSIVLGMMKATAAADASSTTANMSAAALNQQATQFQYQVQQGQQQAQGFLSGGSQQGGGRQQSGSSPWAQYFGGGNF